MRWERAPGRMSGGPFGMGLCWDDLNHSSEQSDAEGTRHKDLGVDTRALGDGPGVGAGRQSRAGHRAASAVVEVLLAGGQIDAVLHSHLSEEVLRTRLVVHGLSPLGSAIFVGDGDRNITGSLASVEDEEAAVLGSSVADGQRRVGGIILLVLFVALGADIGSHIHAGAQSLDFGNDSILSGSAVLGGETTLGNSDRGGGSVNTDDVTLGLV